MYFLILSMSMTNKARRLFSGLFWPLLKRTLFFGQLEPFNLVVQICETLRMFRNWIQNVRAFSIACANYCRRRYTNCIQFMQNNNKINSSDMKEKKECEDKGMKTKVWEGLIWSCVLCFNLFLIHFVPIHLLFIKVTFFISIVVMCF